MLPPNASPPLRLPLCLRPRRQALAEFVGDKRTCQRALDAHNLRRRKRDEAKRSGAAGSGSAGSGDGTGSHSCGGTTATLSSQHTGPTQGHATPRSRFAPHKQARSAAALEQGSADMRSDSGGCQQSALAPQQQQVQQCQASPSPGAPGGAAHALPQLQPADNSAAANGLAPPLLPLDAEMRSHDSWDQGSPANQPQSSGAALLQPGAPMAALPFIPAELEDLVTTSLPAAALPAHLALNSGFNDAELLPDVSAQGACQCKGAGCCAAALPSRWLVPWPVHVAAAPSGNPRCALSHTTVPAACSAGVAA